MLKPSKDANKTIRSIQNIVTDSKRDKQIDHSKTRFIFDKQKQILTKTWKTRTKRYRRHGVGYKIKLQNSDKKKFQGLQKLSKNTTKTEIDTKCTKQGKS